METQRKETFNEIIQGETPVLVDFSAEWCGPCKMMAPILKDFAGRMGGRVRVLKIDVDQSPLVANAYRIQGVPTLILFQKGQIVWRQSGVVQAHQLEHVVNQFESAT
ncbi:thioredoxin [Spirosoma sp. SC4-14]|uniref:thioredoxin n=1 Tax=Spirosoma sp. SC4-14 TaxID=3128900 RepID=UPI0030CE109C